MKTPFCGLALKMGLIQVFAAVFLVLLSGCASVSRPVPATSDHCWTDQEQIEERTRFYSSVAESQALRATEHLLRLTGKEDMLIRHTKQGITGEFHRERWFYAYLFTYQSSVWDLWIVTTMPQPTGVLLCVDVRGQYFTDMFILGAEPVTNLIYPANASERDPGKNFKPPARAYPIDFDTFWARLEYMLGINPTWASCPSGRSGGLLENKIRGRMEFNPLCHSLIDDLSPPNNLER